MERNNKKSPSNLKLVSIKEEKVIREVNYDTSGFLPRVIKKPIILDLEILPKKPTHRKASQRVLVSIKPRPPVIKTIYIAERNRSGKGANKSGSRLAIGDHSSYTAPISEDDSTLTSTVVDTADKDSEILSTDSASGANITTSTESKCSKSDISRKGLNSFYTNTKFPEKCFVYTQHQSNVRPLEINAKYNTPSVKTNKEDKFTLMSINSSSEEFWNRHSIDLLKLNKRIDHLEQKVLRQELVFRSMEANASNSSCIEESSDTTMKSSSATGRPGCSYIEQYSHIPETSAFKKYANQRDLPPPLSPSKATTIEKEHNSEQYGRDFTTYDGITARGRRQCASVPCKRDNIPNMATERVRKIRHKLNPVRDYRLMDTVHYLAQGEFAPRDDGIKLTPSREAVLSDIIWEDVCRTHWPNTRLNRRAHTERYNTRCELQRLIDSLLRERVAHVERRRRRHYRIVKLNHRHESCRPLGKTGDIIVASHKNKHDSDHNPSSSKAMRQWEEKAACSRRINRSQERLAEPYAHHKRRGQVEDCVPGTSYAASKSPTNRDPTCCYRASHSPHRDEVGDSASPQRKKEVGPQIWNSTTSTSIHHNNGPRLLVSKDSIRRKYKKEEPDLEHLILLPTLVIRTPSNVKRQKKFNELYHRILNVQMKDIKSNQGAEVPHQDSDKNPEKKSIGLNVNIIFSSSEENIRRKEENRL